MIIWSSYRNDIELIDRETSIFKEIWRKRKVVEEVEWLFNLILISQWYRIDSIFKEIWMTKMKEKEKLKKLSDYLIWCIDSCKLYDSWKVYNLLKTEGAARFSSASPFYFRIE